MMARFPSFSVGRQALLPTLLAVIFLCVAWACGPTPTTEKEPPKTTAYGPFDCVDRTAVEEPPSTEPPRAAYAETEPDQKTGGEGPALTSPLCPPGQVPQGVAAEATVAKGNPLLGVIEAPPELFFKGDEKTAETLRRSLRPFEEVYPLEGQPEPPPDPPACNGVAYYGSCYYYGSAAYAREADGGGMTLTVERPAYDGSGGSGHTLDEIAVQGGEGNGNIVEVGWNVSTSQYDDADPHLFVFHWIDWSPTCYDGCGWHQYSATYFPGMDLSALVGREVYAGWVFYEGNWWAWFDNQWLGYFPGSEWHGTYTRNNLIQWFGEVATANGLPPHTDMGDGQFPASASAARNFTLCDVDAAAWVCWYRDQQTVSATFTSYYDISRTGFGATRYGGPGE